MATFLKDKIRNIALIGHGGEGKTSLMEAMLFATKGLDRLGKVEDGKTVSDYDQEEKNRKMSISLSTACAYYKDYKINILDTPGFFDFEGEMVAALHVADAAIIVTMATGDMSVGAEKAIDYCLEKGIPMFMFINGVNKENTNYMDTVKAYGEKYGSKVTPIELPIMNGYNMTGYVDILAHKAFALNGQEIAVPSELADETKEINSALTEVAAETDEELMEKYFEEGELSNEEIFVGCKKMFLSAEFIPTVAGVVTTPILTNLFENIINLFPSPAESKTVKAIKNGETEEIEINENGKFSAQIFKVTTDCNGVKQLLFKAVTGSIKTGDALNNPNKDKTEKVTSLNIIKGNKPESVDAIYAGDIGTFAKMSYTGVGDTLCDASIDYVFAPIEYPNPVLDMAVFSEEKGKEDKVFSGLYRLMEEDPTFRIEKNLETLETIIYGMGDTQLDVLCKKVKAKEKVDIVLKQPRIPYRETIQKTIEQQGKYKKQSGGHGQYGDAYIRFEPKNDGIYSLDSFEFAEEIVGGVVPKNYFPAVEKGLRECILKGVLAEYPVVGLRAVLYFGSYHPVDSSEQAFKMAASMAFKEGLPKANPVILEPIMKLKVTVPGNYMGDIMGDVTKRRGRIIGTTSEKGKAIIDAEVPQGEMFKYATDLRSMTQGRGRFVMTADRYEIAPSTVSQKIIEEYKKKKKDEEN